MLSWLTEMRGMDEKVYPLGDGPRLKPDGLGWAYAGVETPASLRLPPLAAASASQKRDVGHAQLLNIETLGRAPCILCVVAKIQVLLW